MPGKSLALSLRTVYETLAISWPTVVDAALGRASREACDRRLAGWAHKVVRRAGIHLEVTGREHLEPGKTYLVMSNHQSHFDVPVLYEVLGGSVRMIAKVELFDVPIFGRAMRDAEFIAIDRSNRNAAIRSLEQAKEKLASGLSVWIAPEGTRSRTGALLPFKKGGFMLALDTKWPILPITIRGTRDVLPAHGLLAAPGQRVDVVIHAPIAPAPYVAMPAKQGRAALEREVRAVIASAM